MSKRKRKKKSGKGRLAMVLVCVGVMAWAWKAYTGHALAMPDGAPAASESVQGSGGAQGSGGGRFTEVRIPDVLRSEMLHYPGFDVSFNSDTHQPNYVAWELTAEEARSQNVKRSNNFAPDMNVGGCPTLDDYRGSGYDRGHMAPSGDMKWSKDAMEACFLLTNMSPQAHELNQGSWRALEEKCRDWAVRDSAIVIVCGPVFDSDDRLTVGATGVAVPDRYFKVVLAPFADPPRAIGFVMPNGKVPGGMQQAAMPVDEVEAITGMDFFPALPDDIEARVEAECNFPRWSRK